MAATLAKGTTVLKNAAREPEIVDLGPLPAQVWVRRSTAKARPRSPFRAWIVWEARRIGSVTDRIELGTLHAGPRNLWR